MSCIVRERKAKERERGGGEGGVRENKTERKNSKKRKKTRNIAYCQGESVKDDRLLISLLSRISRFSVDVYQIV